MWREAISMFFFSVFYSPPVLRHHVHYACHEALEYYSLMMVHKLAHTNTQASVCVDNLISEGLDPWGLNLLKTHADDDDD